jgi:hypothetical protein
MDRWRNNMSFNFNTKCSGCSKWVRVSRTFGDVIDVQSVRIAKLVDPGRPENMPEWNSKDGIKGAKFGAATVSWTCPCGEINNHNVPAHTIR